MVSKYNQCLAQLKDFVAVKFGQQWILSGTVTQGCFNIAG